MMSVYKKADPGETRFLQMLTNQELIATTKT